MLFDSGDTTPQLVQFSKGFPQLGAQGRRPGYLENLKAGRLVLTAAPAAWSPWFTQVSTLLLRWKNLEH